jgi:hypothetical protein
MQHHLLRVSCRYQVRRVNADERWRQSLWLAEIADCELHICRREVRRFCPVANQCAHRHAHRDELFNECLSGISRCACN